MRQLVAYALVVGFAVGVFFASLYPNTFDSWLLVLLGVVVVLVAWRKFGCDCSTIVMAAGIFILAAAGGILRTDHYTNALPATNWTDGEAVSLTGTVIKEPDERQSSLHLTVATEKGRLLVITNPYQNIAYGDMLNVTGTVRRATSFETDLGRTFNYSGYLAARGITHTAPFAEVEIVGADQGNPLIARLLEVKQAFLERIEANLPEPQAGLSEGLLLGVKRALGDELETVFRRTGIIHIVVLSGYNIMLVVAFVLYVLSFLLPWRGRLVVGLGAIVGFALMVGLSATVVRASLMAALALCARAFGRTYAVVQALLVAGFVMLLINPYLLVFDPGFQLSFLATLGLILVAPRLESHFLMVTPVIGVREFLVATLATQLFVLPLLLYQIGEFSLVSVIVNVLVLPMVPIAMLATFIMVLLSFFSGTLTMLVSWLAYAALTYIITVPTFFGQLPFAAMAVPAFPFWVVVLAYALIAYILLRRSKQADPLAGWTIVEEQSLLAGRKTEPPAKSHTPVFFR